MFLCILQFMTLRRYVANCLVGVREQEMLDVFIPEVGLCNLSC